MAAALDPLESIASNSGDLPDPQETPCLLFHNFGWRTFKKKEKLVLVTPRVGHH